MQQSPTPQPTSLNCGGPFIACAPTIAPTADAAEVAREAAILTVVICSLALLSIALSIAGCYYHQWYPILAKKLGWDEESDSGEDYYSSVHSQTALVTREIKRSTILDPNYDIESISFNIDSATISSKPPSAIKNRNNHVKFADENDTELKPMGKFAEAEISANILQEDQSHALLFGVASDFDSTSQSPTAHEAIVNNEPATEEPSVVAPAGDTVVGSHTEDESNLQLEESEPKNIL